MQMKKISIVTVNYNNLKGLVKTIQSVQKQQYSNIEYLVIDGGSIDGSKEYIENHSERISYWVSEPDNGIYDGMNKGIAHATGEYLLFLNSGDFLFSSDILSDVFANKEYDEDLIIGRQCHIDKKGRKSSSHHVMMDEINDVYFWSNTFPHQATFIKKELFAKVGLYNDKYRIVADWAFWYEAIITHQSSYTIIENFISYMESDGVSSDMIKCRKEMAHFLMTHKPILTENDWLHIMDNAEGAYSYKRTLKSGLSKFLVRVALYLNK